MSNRKIGMIDLETGEILDQGTPVWFGRKVHVGKRFFMVFQDAFISLAKDRDITAQPTRVMHYMMGNLDFENFIQVPQAKISKELGMKKQDVSKSMKLLCDKKILLEGPKIGRSFSYRMNPHFGWKGKVSSFKKAKKSHLNLAIDNSKTS
jgi:hypothetical protein